MNSAKSLSIAALLMVSGCSDAPTTSSVEQEPPIVEVVKPRFEQAQIDAAVAAVKAEPAVIDLVYQDNVLGVDWTVGVKDDGSSRYGYALYVCQLLREHSVVDKDTDVRIVDYSTFMASEGDSRAASLGHAGCIDERNLRT